VSECRAGTPLGSGGISALAPAFVSECPPKEVCGRITGLFPVMGTTVLMISALSTVRVQFLVSAISGFDVIYRDPVGIGIHVSDSTGPR
jgi:hypothetical protein